MRKGGVGGVVGAPGNGAESEICCADEGENENCGRRLGVSHRGQVSSSSEKNTFTRVAVGRKEIKSVLEGAGAVLIKKKGVRNQRN